MFRCNRNKYILTLSMYGLFKWKLKLFLQLGINDREIKSYVQNIYHLCSRFMISQFTYNFRDVFIYFSVKNECSTSSCEPGSKQFGIQFSMFRWFCHSEALTLTNSNPHRQRAPHSVLHTMALVMLIIRKRQQQQNDEVGVKTWT